MCFLHVLARQIPDGTVQNISGTWPEEEEAVRYKQFLRFSQHVGFRINERDQRGVAPACCWNRSCAWTRDLEISVLAWLLYGPVQNIFLLTAHFFTSLKVSLPYATPFSFIFCNLHTYYMNYYGPLLTFFIACCSVEGLHGMPSQNFNSEQLYSCPTRYQLSYAAPYWATLHPTELCHNLVSYPAPWTELRRTRLSYTAP